ncbi:MAG TPA: hypothetical protein VK835_02795 [Bacteroidia bacterium]|nr:hypothetical protein [Bacteroidia bacterium]
MIKKIIFTSLLTASAAFAFSQTDNKEDESKMIREVVPVQVDKAKFAVPTTPTPPPTETVGKNGKKKTVEAPPAEVAPDTTSPLIPAPASELIKRAQNWVGDNKSKQYTKSNCAAGKSTVCQISFPYQIKELNPTDKVEGEITMSVTIDAKEGKYRYTINNIKHKAKVADASGGDVYATVPECGSMKLTELSWKHIKAAAFADAKIVTDDLKAKMAQDSGDAPKKDDW